MLKEKQEKARLENITDSEQAIADLNRRHERDKQILLEENKKLNTEIESVSFLFLFWVLLVVVVVVSVFFFFTRILFVFS